MKVETTTVLYCIETNKIKGIVEAGQHWGAPESVKPFEGTLEEFFREHPEYDTEENRENFEGDE